MQSVSGDLGAFGISWNFSELVGSLVGWFIVPSGMACLVILASSLYSVTLPKFSACKRCRLHTNLTGNERGWSSATHEERLSKQSIKIAGTGHNNLVCNCRKNTHHRVEFSHPGDPDYDNTDLPECPYGTACYRKNRQHRLDFKHTTKPRQAKKPRQANNPQYSKP